MNSLSLNFKGILSKINKNSCPYFVNFHCHTTFSDGSLSPLELFKQAIQLKLNNLSITDHHSIEAYLELQSNSNIISNSQVRLWPGIEITAILDNCLVHILCFDFDVNNKLLFPYIQGKTPSNEFLSARKVVDVFHEIGGLCFLAHPARYRLSYRTLIEKAFNTDFDGIEVWYDYERKNIWKPSELICDDIYKITKKYNMLVSTGTDTHGLSIIRR